MKQKHTKPIEEHDKLEPAPSNGKDEMNLAEFPFATLRTRGDSREAIIYKGSIVEKDGSRQDQKWIVRGLTGIGLPTEFDERVLIALMAVTAAWGFLARKVRFSVYQVLRIMGLTDSKGDYQNVEESLKRLVGVTIYSESAFWHNEKKERITTTKAFHLIEEYWLRYRESNKLVREQEGVPGYIVWSEMMWNSFKANYIKNLDLAFFYSLQTPLARRLYRFLDKRMQYQGEYEIDIFELANRLGMAYYSKPAWIRRKLQPAFDELTSSGFLRSAKPIKVKGYNRIRFVKATKKVPKSVSPQPTEQHDDAQEPGDYQDPHFTRLAALRKHYGITDDLVELWEQALVEIAGATTKANFQMWFPQTHLLSCKQGVALIGVPSTFAQDWLSGRMTPVIKRALEGAVGHPVDQLAFQVLTLSKEKD